MIDWFHITMRLTVLQQQRKALQAEQPRIGEEIAKQLESVKHLLWHGNAEEALERLGGLIIELDLLRAFLPAADKLRQGIGEFETYIRNNIEFIPNFGERYRQGETISTAFVESTINQVVSKRFVKSSRCSGCCGAHTYCYRRGPKYLTTTLRTSSAAGTQSFMLRRLDPRFFDAL